MGLLAWITNLGMGGSSVEAPAPTDFYVRADGTAAKADATGPTSDVSACMSMATCSAEAQNFNEGDTVNFSGLGGDYAERLVGRSAGVTYQNATGESPVMYTWLGTGRTGDLARHRGGGKTVRFSRLR